MVEEEKQLNSTRYFIQNVKEILKRQGMSETELAKRAGISQGGLNDFLNNDNGRSPGLDYAEKIANVLGYPLPALIVPSLEFPSMDWPMDKNWEVSATILPKVLAGFTLYWVKKERKQAKKVEKAFCKKRQMQKRVP